jgi:subtilisin family serine protease
MPERTRITRVSILVAGAVLALAGWWLAAGSARRTGSLTPAAAGKGEVSPSPAPASVPRIQDSSAGNGEPGSGGIGESRNRGIGEKSPATLSGSPAPRLPDSSSASLPDKREDFGSAAVDARETKPDADGRFQRVRVVVAKFKYPYLRIEETLRRDPSTGEEAVENRIESVADHILVQLRPGMGEDRLEDLNRRFGAQVLRPLKAQGLYLVQLPRYDVDAVPDAVRAYTAEADLIAFAEPDAIAHAAETIPNDPEFGQLYGLYNTGQSDGTADADIDATEAWDLTVGGPVVVGVIDTGVQINHVDLSANIWVNPGEIPGDKVDNDNNGYVDDVNGWDFLNEDGDPWDDNSHGTHVSGTIAGVGNNGVGVVGVAWTAQIMALKFLGAGGSGPVSDAVDALAYAVMMRNAHGVNIRLTSNSWGSGSPSQSLDNMIRQSGEAGMLFIAAAGNDGRDTDAYPHYPSASTNANLISVAATDRNDKRASFSNYGAVSVDLGAPGSSIYSTVPVNEYGTKSGTSMATPHVAGAAALVWSLSPEIGYEEVRDVLFLGTDPIPALAGITVTGGRLNVLKALQNLGMRVRKSAPGRGQIVGAPTNEFSVVFTYPYEPSTLEASDLAVDGMAADSVSAVDDVTAVFSFGQTPVTNEGAHLIHMAPGAVLRQGNGQPVGEYSASFRYDVLPMQIVSMTPAEGSTVTLPLTTLRLDLNEPFDPASLSAGDILLSQGRVTNVVQVDADTVDCVVTGAVTEGILTVTVPAGGFTDMNQNPSLAFNSFVHLDAITTPYPVPFERVEPAGSMIYDPTASAFVTPAGDADEYTMSLDAGQTLTLLVEPDEGLRPSAEVSGPGGASLGGGQSVAAGSNLWVQTVPVDAAGTYTIVVSGAGGSTGGYTVHAYLNTAFEDEAQGGSANNSLLAAQPLDAAFIDLATTGARRAAVLGSVKSAATSVLTGENMESGALGAGWSTYSSDAAGRVRVTGEQGTATGSYALVMDRWPDGSYTLNEAVWTVDLSGLNQAFLSFAHTTYADETQSFTGDFEGHANADGVAISDDGVTWHPIWNAAAQTFGQWQRYGFDLNAKARDGGMFLGPGFRIRFQQYDNGSVTGSVSNVDGRGWDEIEISVPALEEDWFSFPASSGERVSLHVFAMKGGRLAVDVFGPSGQFVASGVTGEGEAYCENVLLQESGRFHARVSGSGDESYTLLVTAQGLFEREPDDALAAARNLGASRVVHGSIDCPPWLFAVDWISPYPPHILQLDPATGRELRRFNAPITPLSHSSTVNLAFDGTNLWFNGGTNTAGLTLFKLDGSNGAVLDSFTTTVGQASGLGCLNGELFVANTSTNIISVFDAATYALKRQLAPAVVGSLRGLEGDAKRGVLWLSSNFQRLYKMDPLTGAILAERNYSGERHGIEQGLGIACDELFVAEGAVNEIAVYDAETLASIRRFDAPVRQLLGGLAGFNQGLPPDWLKFGATAGDHLGIATQTPGGEPQHPYEFRNALDPELELYNPAGALVAFDAGSAGDGKNASLQHTAALSGSYSVRVTGADRTRGEYVLTVAGATGGPGVFEVESTDPASGGLASSATGEMSVRFSAGVLASTLSPGDLLIDGAPAVSARLASADTAAFGLPPLSAAAHAFSISAGSILSTDGNPVSAYAGSFAVVVAQQAADGFRSPGTNLHIVCTFDCPPGQSLASLLWTPVLPQGWKLLSAAGSGSPEAMGGDIVFLGSLAADPLNFEYVLEVPGNQPVTGAVAASVDFQFESMQNPLTVPAAPAPLILPRYHSADYRAPYWVVDAQELNRVLAYWRVGGYRAEPGGLDGFVATNQPPDSSATNAGLHSADFADPRWTLDAGEMNRLLAYWRAGGYGPNPAGADGYAPAAEGLAALGAPRVTVRQQTGAFYSPGQTVVVSNSVACDSPLLGLAWRPVLPRGWVIESVTGSGQPELNKGEILWTGSLPAGPVSMTYVARVPVWEIGSRSIGGVAELFVAGALNAEKSLADPQALAMTPLDEDRDGLADGWELYYGGNPLKVSPDADPDGDSAANWEEYVAGTDPTARDSVLRITGAAWRDGALRMEWPSSFNRRYSIGLSPGAGLPFAPLRTDVQATPPTNRWVLEWDGSAGAFMKLEVEPAGE